jgi:hypothetical protein
MPRAFSREQCVGQKFCKQSCKAETLTLNQRKKLLTWDIAQRLNTEMKTTSKITIQPTPRFYVGWLLVCVAVVSNQWLLTRLFSADGVLEVETRVQIWLFEAILFVTGCVLLSYRKLAGFARPTKTLMESYPRILAFSTGILFSLFMILCAEATFFALNRYEQSKVPSVQFSTTGRLFDESDENFGFKHLANVHAGAAKKRGDNIVYSVNYSTDAYGRRQTPVVDIEKRSRFVLFFGCSFTFGEGVNDNETLPYYVGERALGYRPYNYGVMGYGPQELLAKLETGRLRDELHEKDGILVYTFIDDHVRRAIGTLEVVNSWGGRMPYYTIDSHGMLVRNGSFTSGRPILSTLYWALGKSQIGKYFHIELPRRITEDDIRLTAVILEKSARLFEAQFHSKDFYVLIYPGSRRTNSLIRYLRAGGINYLDYSKLFDPNEPDLSFDGDPHPKPKAYQIVRDRLVRDLNLIGGESLNLGQGNE